MDVWEIDRIRPTPSHPEVLRSDEGVARCIALAIRRDEKLGEHEVHEHAWLMVLDGLLDVESGGENIEAGRGTLLHFDPAERRTISAKTDATMIYMLAPWPGVGHPSLGAAVGTDSASRP
jgi:quercetin dioxygenase-like cupin family protein